MTDPLNRLKSQLRSGTPQPDSAQRRRAIELAEKEFDRLQGTGTHTRPIDDRANSAGIFRRTIDMLTSFSLRPTLLAGSSLAVIALAVVITGQIERPRIDQLPEARVSGKQPSVTTRTASGDAERHDTGADIAAEPVAPMVIAEEASGAHNSRAADVVAAMPAPLPEGGNLMVLPESTGSADLMPIPNSESYPDFQRNGLKITSEEPVSTFSVDVDTTSYSLLRMAMEDGYPLPRQAIRIEEWINYFDYDYTTPSSPDTPFTVSAAVRPTPWNDGTQLLQIGIKGYEINPADRAPMGLVFLIDTSGSMHSQDKLPLLVKSFKMLLKSLNPDDWIAIVTYAGSAGVVLEPTQADDEGAVMAALDRLEAGGSTAGQAGLQQAYSIAESMVEDGLQSRIILATDGDFNVGINSAEDLTSYIAKKRESGIHLSVLGFGRGNYQDTTMQALAQNGNGIAAYIDGLNEAQKVLVDDVTASLVTIASDVKIQVEFNPAQIAEYRLIGYETRALNREDFNNDRVDAGDIGAGHTVTAIYEMTPVGSAAQLTDDLRYQSGTTVATTSEELAFVKLRYKIPGETSSNLMEFPVMADTNSIPATEANFAAAVAGFGQLKSGEDLGDWSVQDVLDLAQSGRGDDPFGYRSEFINWLRMSAN